MSYLEYINEVKVSGIVISAVEKKMTDQSIGLLIKLKNRMKTEVDGEIRTRFSAFFLVYPESGKMTMGFVIFSEEFAAAPASAPAHRPAGPSR